MRSIVQLLSVVHCCVVLVTSQKVCSVTDYGAVGDGVTLNTQVRARSMCLLWLK